jgi:hypothetical protein
MDDGDAQTTAHDKNPCCLVHCSAHIVDVLERHERDCEIRALRDERKSRHVGQSDGLRMLMGRGQTRERRRCINGHDPVTTFLEHPTEPSLAAPQIEREPARWGQQLEKWWEVDAREEMVVAWGSRPRCPVLGLCLPGVAEAVHYLLLLRFGWGLDLDAEGFERVG